MKVGPQAVLGADDLDRHPSVRFEDHIKLIATGSTQLSSASRLQRGANSSLRLGGHLNVHLRWPER